MMNLHYFPKIFGNCLLRLKIRAKFKFMSFWIQTVTKPKIGFNLFNLKNVPLVLSFPKCIYLQFLDFENYFLW